MATWHQNKSLQRGGTLLDHPTGWTLVYNPPHSCMSLTRYETAEKAETTRCNLENLNPHEGCYYHVLPPRPSKKERQMT